MEEYFITFRGKFTIFFYNLQEFLITCKKKINTLNNMTLSLLEMIIHKYIQIYKKTARKRFSYVVPTGFEPVTHGFSVRCSTN